MNKIPIFNEKGAYMAKNMNSINTDDFKIEEFNSLMSNTQAHGALSQSIVNNLYGINHMKADNLVADSKMATGYVFFTRPQLNMTAYNLAKNSFTRNFISDNDNSIQTYIRCLLDPRLILTGEARCPALNNNLAFIPMLTNNITSLSGWQDIVAGVFASKEGVRKEQYAQIDGTTDILNSYDIDANFRNSMFEPITLAMLLWVTYSTLVHNENLNPYPDMLAENEIDSNTRIYRLIMDPTGMYVNNIAATGVSFPVNVPLGKLYDYNKDEIYVSNNKELNIRFKSIGATYYDAITVHEFNEASMIFETELRSVVDGGFKSNSKYEKVPTNLKKKFNFRGFPLIDYNTYELTWWVKVNSPEWKEVVNLSKGIIV